MKKIIEKNEDEIDSDSDLIPAKTVYSRISHMRQETVLLADGPIKSDKLSLFSNGKKSPSKRNQVI